MILNKAKQVSFLLIFLYLGGCAVIPEPITVDERQDRAELDLATLFSDQEAVSGPISLYEAMARALKYNTEYRLQLMQQVVSNSELDISRYDLLPQLAVEAGYTNRDNVNASNSLSVTTGTQSLETSSSQDRNITTGRARIVWNVLDFGVSYLRQQQAADQTLIAEEQRRKVIQNIIQDTRRAYWRVIAAERVTEQLEQTVSEVEQAVETSEQMQEEGVSDPLTTLNYRRNLLRTLGRLVRTRDQLELARSELAQLMNLPPASEYDLELPNEKTINADIVGKEIVGLQKYALIHRPELIELDYSSRIVEKDGKITKLELLPGVTFSSGLNYDSNRFLLNQNWYDIGVQVSFDLMRLARLPVLNQLQTQRKEVVDLQRKALTSAVMTQVELAIRTFITTDRDYQIAKKTAVIEQLRLQQFLAQKESGTGEKLDLVLSNADTLLASLEQYQRYADVQDNFGAILNSLGINPLPDTVEDHDLPTLSQNIQTYFEQQLPQQLSQTLN